MKGGNYRNKAVNKKEVELYGAIDHCSALACLSRIDGIKKVMDGGKFWSDRRGGCLGVQSH
eukprot:scaffold11172_cov156-Skeletonema_marinoi.AAC.4